MQAWPSQMSFVAFERCRTCIWRSQSWMEHCRECSWAFVGKEGSSRCHSCALLAYCRDSRFAFLRFCCELKKILTCQECFGLSEGCQVADCKRVLLRAKCFSKNPEVHQRSSGAFGQSANLQLLLSLVLPHCTFGRVQWLERVVQR